VGQLSQTARRLGEDLNRLLNAPAADRGPIALVPDRVADLVLQALFDEEHRLAEELKLLQARCELEREGTLYREAERSEPNPTAKPRRKGDPNRHLFMPHPGVSDPEASRYWRLQLLLQTAARSKLHGERVAERLGLSPAAMRSAADEAAASISVSAWTTREHMTRLAEAVSSLEAPDPEVPFKLDGRQFVSSSGVKVQLSPQEATFLRLLAARPGHPVMRTTMRDAGIVNPVHVKNRLEDRLRDENITLHIASATGSYALLLSP
jgi:hypothetical protein